MGKLATPFPPNTYLRHKTNQHGNKKLIRPLRKTGDHSPDKQPDSTIATPVGQNGGGTNAGPPAGTDGCGAGYPYRKRKLADDADPAIIQKSPV